MGGKRVQDAAITDLNKTLRGSTKVEGVIREKMVGGILIANKREGFQAEVESYTNKGIKELLRVIIKYIGEELGSEYRGNHLMINSMLEYYKEIEDIQTKKEQSWFTNPLYTVIKNITSRVPIEGAYNIYEREVKEREIKEKGESGYPESFNGLLLRVSENTTDGEVLWVTESEKGIRVDAGELYTREILKESIEIEYTENIGSLIDIYTERYKKVIYKTGSNKKTKEILKSVTGVAKAVKQGGVCLAVVPITALVTKAKEKDEFMENHTLEGVISLRASDRVLGVNPQCIVIIKANEPHEEGKKTWFGYWGKGGVTESNLRNYKERREVLGESIRVEVGVQDEWVPEQHLKESYKRILGVEPETTKVKELFDLERSETWVERDLKQRKPSEGVALLGSTGGVKGYFDGEGKTNVGGVIVVTPSKPFYQEKDFISNTNQTLLRPKEELTEEERGLYLEVLKQNYKRFDKSRTPTVGRVGEIEVPDIKFLRRGKTEVKEEGLEEVGLEEEGLEEVVREGIKSIEARIKEKELEIQESEIELEETKIRVHEQELWVQEKRIELSKLRLEKQKEELEEYKTQEAQNAI